MVFPLVTFSRWDTKAPKATLGTTVLVDTASLVVIYPRLPKTPATRIPRHKERVYSISVNGSPISEGGNDIVINVPVGNGEVSGLPSAFHF